MQNQNREDYQAGEQDHGNKGDSEKVNQNREDYQAGEQDHGNKGDSEKVNITMDYSRMVIYFNKKGTTPYDIFRSQHYYQEHVFAEVNGKLWDMHGELENFCFLRFIDNEYCHFKLDDRWYDIQRELHEAAGSKDERIIMIAVLFGNPKFLYEISGEVSPLDVVQKYFKKENITDTSHKFKVNGGEIGPRDKLMNHSIIELEMNVEKEEGEEEEEERNPMIKIALIFELMSKRAVTKKNWIQLKCYFKDIYSDSLNIDSFITMVGGHIWNPKIGLTTDSQICLINPRKNVKDANNNHSVSYFDEQLKMNWYYSMMVQHNIGCRLRNEGNCPFSLCKTFKEIINHLMDCKQAICSTPDCTKVRYIRMHMKKDHVRCLICDAIKHARFFQPHPMFPSCFNKGTYLNNSTILPKDCNIPISRKTVASPTKHIDVRDVASSSAYQISGSKVFMPDQALSSKDPVREDLQVEVRQLPLGVSNEEKHMISEVGSRAQQEDEKEKKDPVYVVYGNNNVPLKKKKFETA